MGLQSVDDASYVDEVLNAKGVVVVVYKDGQLLAQQAGMMNSAQFAAFLKQFV